jgi:hypothetical protein
MALALNDRVQQTGTANTTVSFTLTASVTGFQTFAIIGNGNTTYYTATDASGNWEVGEGTYSTTGPTLTRDTILSSSNSGSAVTFSGSVNVFVTYPSEKSVNQDADGNVNILTYVPNTTTNLGTLNVGDGTYNVTLSGQIASFGGADPVVNGINIQNTSTSNTAYTALQIGADTFNTGYYLQIGTNSSTYDYAAAGYPNSSINQPDTHYILANKADLGIATWDAEDIHFIQNASTATTDSMTLYANGGVSLGGLASPGLGNIACNNINLKFQQILTTGGTTFLTNASPYYTQFTGTNTENLQLPDATTCLVGTTFIFDNDSTQNVNIKDGAGTTFELLVPGGYHNFVLEDNSTIAGTWLRYSSVPATVEWGTNSLSLATTVISGGTWQGGTIGTAYGGTGLTTYTSGGAVYATSSSTLTSGTLPVTAGGTGQTAFSSGYIPYGNSSAALQSSASLQFNGTYLVVGGTSPIGGATNPIAAFTGAANNFVQTYVYNATNGTSASADFVAYGNNGSDTSGFVDMGYTSQTYADATYSVTGANEGYIFGSAPSGSGTTGNLVYATDSTGSANAHQWYVGGFNQAKGSWKMQLTSTGLQLADALGAAYGGTGLTAPGAAGNALVSNGTTWTSAAVSAAVADGCIYENNLVISSNYTLTTGRNAMSVGPITVDPGVSVTVPSGQRWVVL